MLVLEFKNVVDLPKKLRPRQANFPEVVSQYFVYRILKNKLLKSVNLNVTSSSADLLINSDIVEVKAGVAGPSTLTIPKKWDSIKYFYFLDCSNWQSSGIAYLYEIDWDRLKDELKVKHDSPTDKKRRIKYSFFDSPYRTLVWSGAFDDICKDT